MRAVVGCFAILLFALIAVSAAAAEVRLRSSAVCTSSVVRLSDVAEVHAADQQLGDALADVPLCAAPAQGSERQFTQQEVRQLLAFSGVATAAVQVTGSETVTLLTEHRPTAPVIKRPRGAYSMHRQATFEAEIPISRDASVRRSEAKPMPLQETKAAASKPTRLVERGALCTVHARTGSIRVTTQGKALQAGTFGETISIEMADTKERVLGRITGSQIVEVGVGAAPVANQPSSAPSLLPVPVATNTR